MIPSLTVITVRAIRLLFISHPIVQLTIIRQHLLLRLAEQRFVLLLGLDESLLELVGVCKVSLVSRRVVVATFQHSLSLLAKRIARV
jgi:hypothetical protein